jgi:uncharacterized protein
MPKRRTRTSASIVAASPTMRIAGEAAPQLAAALLDLEIRRAMGQRTTCHARFSALGLAGGQPVLQFLDRQLIDFGTPVSISVAERILFAGTVAAIEAEFRDGAAPAAGMRAEDAYRALATKPRRRSFTRMTDADIAARIAAENGLSATIEMPGPVIPRLVQSDTTDLDFLRARAAVNRVDLILDDAGLVLRRRRAGSATTLIIGAALRGYTGAAAITGPAAAIVGRAVVDGTVDVALGGTLDLRGIGAVFTGTHAVTEIVTRFDRTTGLQTILTCERMKLSS